MKKITNYLKTLLVAALVMVGSSAWAEDVYTTIYQRNVTYGNDAIWSNDDKGSDEWNSSSVFGIDVPTTSDDETAHHGLGYLETSSFTSSYNSSKTFSLKENSKVKYEITWYVGGAPGVNKAYTSFNYHYLQIGDHIRLNWHQNYTFCLNTDATCTQDNALTSKASGTYTKEIVIICDRATKTIEKFTFGGVDITNKVSGTFDENFDKVVLGFQRGTTATNYNAPNYITNIVVSECEQEVSISNYTINYMNGDNKVKSVSSSSTVGSVITAETTIDGEGDYLGNHYLITAESAPSMTLVANSESNVLNVPVRAPYTATVQVTTILDGTAQTPIVTNYTETDAKDCSWNYFYSKYLKNGDKYYLADDVSKFGEIGTFTDGQNIEKTVAYTSDGSVAVFVEAESKNTNSSNNTSFSGGKTGYVTGGNSYSLGTLSAGTYNLSVYLQERGDRGIYLRNGSTTGTEIINLGTDKNSAAGEYNKNFTLTEPAALYITGYTSGTSTNQCANIDYILIKAVSISKEITAAGYATFCSPYALDFTGTGLTAYIAKVDGEKNVSFEEVKSVPANTGVLLKGEANTYEIPVAASSTTDVIDNAFIGTTTGTTAEAGSFVLMNETSGGVGFYRTTADFTVGANTAYLPKAAGGARAFIGFDFNEATAIKAVESVKAENGAFNLRGQRVKNLTKGLYIVNGKKVVK